LICDKIGSLTAIALKRSHPIMRTALSWIEQMPNDIKDGVVNLKGNDLYVNVHRYSTRAVDQCMWESHRQTMDIQYCISGAEIIEWIPSGNLESMDDYSSSLDVEHWHGNVDAARIRLTPGMFTVFLPNEPHRPQLRDIAADEIRKVAVKIKAHLLDL
jgi:YhcH/YjgK/YiaL family protein